MVFPAYSRSIKSTKFCSSWGHCSQFVIVVIWAEEWLHTTTGLYALDFSTHNECMKWIHWKTLPLRGYEKILKYAGTSTSVSHHLILQPSADERDFVKPPSMNGLKKHGTSSVSLSWNIYLFIIWIYRPPIPKFTGLWEVYTLLVFMSQSRANSTYSQYYYIDSILDWQLWKEMAF